MPNPKLSSPDCQTVKLSSPSPSPSPDDWLSQLDLSVDSLPDLRAKGRALKAKGRALKHIKGEKHKFIPAKPSRVPIREPRKLAGEAIPKIFRDFWPTNLEQAVYSPRDMIGISPFWPSHLTLSDSDFM